MEKSQPDTFPISFLLKILGYFCVMLERICFNGPDRAVSESPLIVM